MRRRAKYIRNGALILGGVALAIDLYRQWHEKKDAGKVLTLSNYDYERSFRKTFIPAAAGALMGNAIYEYCIYEENKIPFDADAYLLKILSGENIKNDPTFFNNVLQKRNAIRDWAMKMFGTKLAAPPQDAGSFAKRTANVTNYDLDLVLIFNTNSFYSLKEMYYHVYDAVQNKFGDEANVEKRTRAITITYTYNGEEICFDIVPGRLISNAKNKNDINLYVRPDWVWQRGSSYKTNPQIHARTTVLKPDERKIIRILKLYRDLNKLVLPTTVIEQHVLKAMSANQFGIDSSITENLLNCMQYIAGKIKLNHLPDITNTNSNLQSHINNTQKERISELLLTDVAKIEDRPGYLKEIFEN